jgi:ABC-type Na+ efflux pump permease subunit
MAAAALRPLMENENMNEKRFNLLDDLRIIWAIGAKDVVDGLKNRTIWSYIALVLVIMVAYRYLPKIGQADEIEIVIFDQGASRLVEALQNSSVHEIREVSSMAEFDDYMDDGDEGELGLVIPESYDQRLEADEPATIQGYVLWSSRMNAGELIADYEATMSEMIDAPVRIEESGVIIPRSDAMGNVRMIALTPFIIIIIIGMMVVPNLMFEEKTTQTIDTLMVSPARIGHIITGKAVAGAIYCLSAGAIVLAFNWVFVVNWGLAIAAIIGTTALGIGLGLALGVFLKNPQQLGMVFFILFQPILIPVVLFVIEPAFPLQVRNALPWFPNVALVKLFHYSQTSLGSWNLHGGHILVLVAIIILLYVLMGWKLRTSDR